MHTEGLGNLSRALHHRIVPRYVNTAPALGWHDDKIKAGMRNAALGGAEACAPCMRFCSFSALRTRASLAFMRDLLVNALGLRFISAVGASSLPLSFFFCTHEHSRVTKLQ